MWRIDKFFRKYSGAASTLISFHSGYIYLEIRIDDRLRIPLEKITRNVAKSWRNEPELRGATGFSASIYRSPRRSGFVLEGSATTAEQAELIRRMKEPANQPDAFLKIIEEEYGAEDYCESASNASTRSTLGFQTRDWHSRRLFGREVSWTQAAGFLLLILAHRRGSSTRR